MDRRGERRDGRRDESRRSGSRLPPHNLQAEESVLGALLLSRDAIGAVSEQGLRPDDFYKPAHQHLFDAIRALYSTGAPADTITVADELRRAGLLEQVGGVETLHTLQNATPAISNAAHYARIVQDTAVLRRLIHVAGDIAELAYGEPDDVTKAVDEAESKVFRVAEERVVDSTQLLSETIKGVMDRLEETFARGDSITGTATGYHDIDELLSGLQPSTLNIVGARPAMGKCVAWDTPILDVVTGEVVTVSELGDRAASRGSCSVPALGPDGRLCTATVSAFVHDGVKPVFWVRTASGRSVRLTASHPLLTADGWRPLTELSVGEEIAVPARRSETAASSRQLPDLLPLAVWRDISKAIADDGSYPRRLRLRRDTVARLAETLDDDQLRWWASPDMRWERIVTITPAGDTDVVDLTVPGLHNFVAADIYLHNTAFGLGMATHVAQTTGRPVLVFSLEMGHNELTQRILASEAKVDSMKMRNGRLTESDWAKIGRAIGRLEVPLFLDDNPRVTVMEIRAKARRLKARHGGLALIVVDYLQLMSGGGNPENRQLEVSEISRNLKILARELEVPIVALSQLSRNLESRHDKRPMLSDLRESGCLTADATLVRADTETRVTLGELVAADARNIPLWSLDERYRLVPARLVKAFASGTKPTFRLALASGRAVEASSNHPFLTIGGWRPVDSLTIGEHLATARRSPGPATVDTIPPVVWEHVLDKALPAAGLTASQLAAALGMQYCAASLPHFRLSRSRLARIAALTGDPWLRDLACSDVCWDRIVGITPLGERPVFDATIEGTHNFVANGIIAHNSLEQDADVVMFLYRDEVYNAESPDKGAAEVIVAKHRSGPIGTKRLVFLGQYTRFDNAARGV